MNDGWDRKLKFVVGSVLCREFRGLEFVCFQMLPQLGCIGEHGPANAAAVPHAVKIVSFHSFQNLLEMGLFEL